MSQSLSPSRNLCHKLSRSLRQHLSLNPSARLLLKRLPLHNSRSPNLRRSQRLSLNPSLKRNPSHRLSLSPRRNLCHKLSRSHNLSQHLSARHLLRSLPQHNSQNSQHLSQSHALKSRPPPSRTLHHPRPPRRLALPLSQQRARTP